MSLRNKIKFFKKLSRAKKWTVLRKRQPQMAKIEICGHCNLDCIMCLRTSLENRNQLMTLEQFKTILDHLPDLIFWSPHGYNEPLCHPDFLSFVKEASRRGISLNLVTNGLLLTDEIMDRLMSYDMEVHRITFSIDGTGDRYEQIRKGGSWKHLKERLALCGLIFDTEIHATIWAGENSNIDQVMPLKELALHYGMPITFNDITLNEYNEATSENAIRINVTKELIDRVEDNLKGPTVRILFQQREPRSCTLPWTSVYVDVVGDCFPCTDNLDHWMGNLLLNPISAIYHLDKYEFFRRVSEAGTTLKCRGCLAWGKNR